MALNPSELLRVHELKKELGILSSAMVSKKQEVELQLCAKNPWYWAQKYLYTLAEDDLETPIKKHPDWPLLHDMFRIWMSYPLIRFIHYEKSRRQVVTLTHCALFLHDAMFFDGRLNFIISQNEEKANIQVERRCAIMYDKLPDWMKAVFPAKSIFCQMIFFGNDRDKGK